MQVNNLYSSATLSCLPGQGGCETATAYFTRTGGLKFSAAISTETLAWSDNEDSMRNEVHVFNYCTGARLPSAESVPHNVMMCPQKSTCTQVFTTCSQPEQTLREFIASPKIYPECSSMPKSSFPLFWQWLLQCILPCVKFKK